MTQEQIAQLVASALNIAATLLPQLEEIKAIEGDMVALQAKYDELSAERRKILDALTAPS